MGTRPEDVRYRIEVAPDTWQGPGWAASREVPWLVFEGPDGVVSWVAPVHVLRVALQKQQRHEELVGYCSRLIAPNPGVAVHAVSGSDPSDVVFEGRAVGYQDVPTVVVEQLDGTRRFWAAPLVRPAAPTAVWDDSVAPGGMVCVECGEPVESEPCPEHGAHPGLVTGPGDHVPMNQAVVREVPIRRRTDAVDPEQVVERLLAGEPVPGNQMTVEQARTWLHGPGSEGGSQR